MLTKVGDVRGLVLVVVFVLVVPLFLSIAVEAAAATTKGASRICLKPFSPPQMVVKRVESSVEPWSQHPVVCVC